MDPMLLIGAFFGAGVMFLIAFVVIMVVVSKGKPAKPHARMPDRKHDLPIEPSIQTSNFI